MTKNFIKDIYEQIGEEGLCHKFCLRTRNGSDTLETGQRSLEERRRVRVVSVQDFKPAEDDIRVYTTR